VIEKALEEGGHIFPVPFGHRNEKVSSSMSNGLIASPPAGV
jgi:hypothetical protein